MATVLTLHRGGADPAEIAKLELEAARLLHELVDALPASDRLRSPCGNLASALDMRHLMDEVNTLRAQRKPLGPQRRRRTEEAR